MNRIEDQRSTQNEPRGGASRPSSASFQRGRRFASLAAAVALGAVSVALPTAAPAATADVAAGHHFGRALFAVDGANAHDVWAVGLTPGDKSAIRHWDGSTWTWSSHPRSTYSSVFTGVSASAASDVWAVGSKDPDGTSLRVTATQHWDGSRWRDVDADPGQFTSEANGVDTRAGDDAWLVGDYTTSGPGYLVALTEHWDGKRWSQVPAAKTGQGCDVSLESVSAVAADDVWAAGSQFCSDGTAALVEHWNGKRWSKVAVPTPRGATETGLESITAISSNDVWAVGHSSEGQAGKNLTLHWNGARWSVVSSPNQGDTSCDFGLSSVSGSGSSDVWASGTRSCSLGVTPEMLRWNGTRWSNVAIPATGFDNPAGDGLFGVVSLAKRQAFTVGIAKTRGPAVEVGFIERWNGQQWSLQ